MGNRKRERERECVCVCVRERERERKRESKRGRASSGDRYFYPPRTNLSRNYAVTQIVTRDKTRASGKANLPRECAPAERSSAVHTSSFWEKKSWEIRVGHR